MPFSNPGSPTPSGSGLSQAQLARARSYSYRLFSELFLQGITAVSLPYIQQIPELTAVLPKPYIADNAAANHHELFQFNIFPYESFFLGEDGLVGGDVTAVVNQHAFQLGWQTAVTNNQADHLGHELACLAFLVTQEAEASESDQLAAANDWQTKQQFFLQSHLLRWAPTCLLAIQQQANPFFAELAQVTLNLLLSHADELARSASAPPAFLPPVPDILANDKTGFKEIVHFLLLPALSGIYLSRDTIGQLGRQFDLPRGFGSRETMLLNLLRTAVQYDALPPLLRTLQEMCRSWQSGYQELINQYPKTALFIQPWQARAAATEQMVLALMESSIAE
ncbi:MAG: molecular chaperone TorD family protein [Ardenticatenaceae bacterium]|nr:molecular chaperone TorD family protein [Ardenticatenaceae bacterium]MCB8946384.1 molecular chaperone TorD family protein [Ardenticatenaceae bacterium]